MTNETTKHSPEPWTRTGGKVYAANGNLVAQVNLLVEDSSPEANARLIVKAWVIPELLKAAEYAVRFIQRGENILSHEPEAQYVIASLWLAINKTAKGETP